jgi:hypothetical protein
METRYKKYTREHHSLELLPQRSLQGRGKKEDGEDEVSHHLLRLNANTTPPRTNIESEEGSGAVLQK